MRKKINLLLSIVGVFLMVLFIGILLIILTYSYSSKNISKNISLSADTFKDEGDYVQLIKGEDSTRLDNYTDSLILNELYYDSKKSVFEKAMRNYEYKFKNEEVRSNNLIRNINGDSNSFESSYERYWHGNLVIYKPVFMFLTYSNFKIVNTFIIVLLIGISIVLMVKNKLKMIIVPFALSLFMINPFVISLSLQFSILFYVCIISVITLLSFNEKLKSMFGEKYLLFFFMIIGMVTSYVDLLTYPIITLGAPLIFTFLLNKPENVKRVILNIFLYSTIWVVGYAGMWIFKWVIGSIILSDNLFKIALSQASFRLSAADFTRFDALKANINVFHSKSFLVVFVIIFIYYLIRFLKVKPIFNKKVILDILPFILIFLIPIAWILCLSNHSYIHYWFTFRNFFISFLAFFVILELILTNKSK